MDDETIGRLQGYVQWGADAYWNKKAQEAEKQKACSQVKQQKQAGFQANKEFLQEIKKNVTKKQLPLYEMKSQVYEDIKERLASIKPFFHNMHAELFLADAVYATERIHDNSMMISDVLKRQEKLLHAITSETFEELAPHILFLYEKEQRLQQKNKEHSVELSFQTMRILGHLYQNYFERLASLNKEKQFHEDHKDLFLAAWVLSMCTRAMGNAQGIETTALRNIEQAFVQKIEFCQ